MKKDFKTISHDGFVHEGRISRKRMIALVLALCLLSALLGGFIVYSTSSPNPTIIPTISGGIYPGAPSFTVWDETINGTECYFAKNASGFLSYSGTSFSTVFQNAHNSMPKGGTIFLTQGQYYATSQIEITNFPFRVIGEGAGTPYGWWPPTGYYKNFTGTSIISTITSGAVFYVHPASPQFMEFSDFALRGTNQSADTTDGIYMRVGRQAMFTNLYIALFKGGYGIHLENCYDSWICHNRIEFNKIGLGLMKGSDVCNSNHVLCGDYSHNTLDGIIIQAGMENTVDASIENNGRCGLNITQSGAYWNTIYGAFEVDTIGIAIGSVADPDCHYNRIYARLIADSCTIKVQDYGVKTIYGDIGLYVLENAGNTIFSGTSVAFNHGLAKTPTLVFCSFNSTAITGWTWTATSTQITVAVTPSGTYRVYWYAEYHT